MRSDLPGTAGLVLAANVVHLDPAPAVFEAMLHGWETQQRARYLVDSTVQPRLRLVRRLSQFSNLYPWQWTPSEVEAFIADLRSGPQPLAISTARGYGLAIPLFCEYLTDARYGWPAVCLERFGEVPQQVMHEGNSVLHVEDFEAGPGRRPFTYDEVQTFFDTADGLAETIRDRGRKGYLTALRDAALLKVTYAYGMRRQEVTRLDLADLRSNAKAPRFGRCGALGVRYGKAASGGLPQRRTVLLIPEMDWVVPVLEHWLREIRPALQPGRHPALWVTERRGRVSPRSVNDAFNTVRDAAGLDAALNPHWLRHSYVTHLIEFGYPVKFVQDQVGHKHASTTSIYTGVSAEYRNQILQQSLQGRLGQMWGDQP